MHTSNFDQLPLKPELIANLTTLNYHSMTPIQQASLPLVLNQQDVIAKARTGSGKTAAFSLGLLNALDTQLAATQALVLCPTRELAEQVATEIRRLARQLPNVKVLTLCGGVSIAPQLNSLSHGAHIVVGTPGRICDHLNRETLDISGLKQLVLDEADRMLDMGFEDELDQIISLLPSPRQTLLFSATYPDTIQALAKRIMQQPVELFLDEEDTPHANIQQYLYPIADESNRLTTVAALLSQYKPDSALVFCNTRQDCESVMEYLEQLGFYAKALHGGLEQKDRNEALVRFAHGSTSVLVATDVAARGLDIAGLDLVINYQIASDVAVHVHRVGRTGRAEKTGIACVITTPEEDYKLERLQAELGLTLEVKTTRFTEANIKPYYPAWTTLKLNAGKKQKVRPGDILGTLTNDAVGLTAKEVGKIAIAEQHAYVTVARAQAKSVVQRLANAKLKGRNCKAWIVR